MAQDPVSTSIFHKYLLTDNTGRLCHVQVTLITDPIPLNSVNSTYIVGTSAKALGAPQDNLICGEPCLSKDEEWKVVERSDQRRKEGKKEKERTRVGDCGRWIMEMTERKRKERRQGDREGDREGRKQRWPQGTYEGASPAWEQVVTPKSEWGLAHVTLGGAEASELQQQYQTQGLCAGQSDLCKYEIRKTTYLTLL